jgi:hypothetical protein
MRVLILASLVVGFATGAKAQTNLQTRLHLAVQIEPRGVPVGESLKPKKPATEAPKVKAALRVSLQQRREERLRAKVDEAIREATFGRPVVGPVSPASFAAGVPYLPLSNDPSKVEPAGIGVGFGY